MRVLHLAKFYDPDFGGMETAVKSMVSRAIQEGDEVTVLCFGKSLRLYPISEIQKVEVIRATALVSLFSQPISFTLFFRLISMLRTCDIVHIHSPNPLAEFFFVLANTFYRKQYVYHFHSDVIGQRWLRNLYSPMRRVLIRFADSCVVSTSKLIPLVSRAGSTNEKIKVIPFSIPEVGFLEESISKSNGSEKEREPYALFVGRLVSYKGLEILIDVFSRIQKPLKIVGDGPLRPQLEELVIKKKASHFIEFVGAVTDRVRNQLILESAFGVLPSITQAETFGIFSLECMSAGKPMIVTRLGTGTDDVIEDLKTGLVVQPQDREGLKKAVELLFSNETLRHSLGATAQKTFKENYIYETTKVQL